MPRYSVNPRAGSASLSSNPDSDSEEYDSNADEDFNPEAAARGHEGSFSSSSSSSSEDEDELHPSSKGRASAKKNQKSKKNGKDENRSSKSGSKAAVADDGLDSGDEATIRERKKRRRGHDGDNGGKKKTDGGKKDDDNDGSGSESDTSVIKTRAAREMARTQRAHKRRKHAAAGGLDGEKVALVEQIWQELASAPVGRTTEDTRPTTAGREDCETERTGIDSSARGAAGDAVPQRVEYAGEIFTVNGPSSSSTITSTTADPTGAATNASKRESDEPGQEMDVDGAQPQAQEIRRRPLRRRTMFEPNPLGTIKGVNAEKLRVRPPRHTADQLASLSALLGKQRLLPPKAQRLTTVQKSALDWRGFVDRSAGLKEELDSYGKSRHTFLAREDFLDRAQAFRDMRAREARLKG